MDYSKIYSQIIINAKRRVLAKDVYTETHHIVPRCMGGDNSPSNLVELLPREHFLCHWLLHKNHPDNFKLLAAWNAFSRGSHRQISHHYERCRIKWINVLKQRRHTHPDWWRNWTRNSEGKLWINNGKTSKRVSPDELEEHTGNNWKRGRKTFSRKPHSEDHKKKDSK